MNQHAKDWLQVVGTLLSAGAAIFAVYVAMSQLSLAAQSLNAQTTYTLAKDGRALGDEFRAGEADVGDIYNFFHAAWHMRRLGALDRRVWEGIVRETCLLLSAREDARRYLYQGERYTDPFDLEFVGFVKRDLIGGIRCDS